MLMLMFSMAGVPPFVGVLGQARRDPAALKRGAALARIAAVILSVIGAYYYTARP